MTDKLEKLHDNQVKLSDGRIVEVRESVGSDDMIVCSYLGKNFTSDAAGGVIYMNCLVAMCVEKVGEHKVQPLRSYEQYRDFMGQFKKKDWNKIRNLYEKINGDVEGNE